MDTFVQMILCPLSPHHPYHSAFLYSSHPRMRSHEYFSFFFKFWLLLALIFLSKVTHLIFNLHKPIVLA